MQPTLRLAILLLAALLTLIPVRLEASGNGRIEGTIRGPNGKGLFDAVITLIKQEGSGLASLTTRSDPKGFYSLANLTPGSYFLQVVQPGYAPITSERVTVEPDDTQSIDLMLQEFVDYISNNDDERNWDAKTVMRSASSRRLIFRNIQGGMVIENEEKPFDRIGTLTVASSTDTSVQNYAAYPGRGQTSIVSNFAFAEPVSNHSRMIFSGQLNSGYDSYWQVRNAFNYRPSPTREMKVSVGYGRVNVFGSSVGTIGRPSQFFSQAPELRDSGIQTLALGVEGNSRILDSLQMSYGLDVSRVYYDDIQNYLSPYFQVTLMPVEDWTVQGVFASKRLSDFNSLSMPDGTIVNLSEPTFIARLHDRIFVSQFRHSEISVSRSVGDDTSIELAVYSDRVLGAGTPFLITMAGPDDVASAMVAQLSEDQSAQQGLRLVMNRKLFDFLTGTVTYVYGSGTGTDGSNAMDSSEDVRRNILKYMTKSYYHSITSQLDATIPRTGTSLISIVRWYPGDPVTPIDLFADRMDVMTKGVNFRVRQVIPIPEFMGSGRWEALVDVRNLFDQGFDHVRTKDGEILLTRNPRSLRFGLNLNFN